MRWAEILLRLNSLVNPALYFYGHRTERLQLNCYDLVSNGKFNHAVVHTGIREIQHRYCYLPVNELSCDERAQGFTRSHSWTADTHMVAGTLTMCGEPLVKRRMSCPPLIRHENFCQGIQPLTVSVMMQVELIPRKFLYVCKDVQESRPTRSKTCNKYSFLVQENSLYKARRNSAPTVVD